ncbi:hypothetical protein HRI_003240800 [Hibiscus trionum]|uniref:Uncharacterized protein n=1 Tax=Hibiscus trionum TaxID=183268 RepID=A0A9W7IGB7_HIBTR|nr:hypothetical protein HRI_003240800 [Hibiscus trionum]
MSSRGNIHGQEAQEYDIQILMREFTRVMRAELEPIHGRITQLKISQRDCTTRVEPQEEQEAEFGANNVHQAPPPNPRRNDQRGREPLDDDLSNIKVSVPQFQGISDPEAYLA